MTFDSFAEKVATAPVIIWAASGPLFHVSHFCQLVTISGTTIVSVLMMLLIQTQDTNSPQVKLDELIRVTRDARHELLKLEQLQSDKRAASRQDVLHLGRHDT